MNAWYKKTLLLALITLTNQLCPLFDTMKFIYNFTGDQVRPLFMQNVGDTGIYIEAADAPLGNITMLRVNEQGTVETEFYGCCMPLANTAVQLVAQEGSVLYYPSSEGSVIVYDTSSGNTTSVNDVFPSNYSEQGFLVDFTVYEGVIYYVTALQEGKYKLTVMVYDHGETTMLCAFVGLIVGIASLVYNPTEQALFVAVGDSGYAGQGGLYKITLDGQCTLFHSFYGYDGSGPTSLVSENNGMLYGTSLTGGGLGGGDLWSCDPRSGNVTTLYNFDGYSAFKFPFNMISGNDGLLYGILCGYYDPFCGSIYGHQASGIFVYDYEKDTILFSANPFANSGIYAISSPLNGLLYGILVWQKPLSNYQSSLFALNLTIPLVRH